MTIDKEKVFQYHEHPQPGKLAVVPTKPCQKAEDLSLAYTPGVAIPCEEIKANPSLAYEYTSKGNLVAVISNGTAVLGLGDIGPLAGKPVMEGKSLLFKRFAGIDAIDIDVAENDPQKLVEIVASLEPTFGGINLEDIKAPQCFRVEEELISRLKIPVFHDDQQGTAVVLSAALLNALELIGKKIDEVKVVFSGAGAAAVASAKMLLELGLSRKNLFLVDSKGLINLKRKEGLNEYKLQFAQDSELNTLQEVLRGADVFIGVSAGNLLSKEMVQAMNTKPIIFALSNPTPEISYDDAKEAVPEAVVATGRSDYPNQVNNVLCFPFLFRGALDVRAKVINKEMKLAAIKTLASLAKKKVPKSVVKAYGREFSFGAEYILPKPFDPRLLPEVAAAVAKAAMDSGVAGKNINLKEYKIMLKKKASRLAKGKFL
ncbi:MAG: malic enzyme-like NAD(P)-binding protein [Nanoarchaeota archaeon]